MASPNNPQGPAFTPLHTSSPAVLMHKPLAGKDMADMGRAAGRGRRTAKSPRSPRERGKTSWGQIGELRVGWPVAGRVREGFLQKTKVAGES